MVAGDDIDTISTPFAIRKILDVNLATRYDVSGTGYGNDVINEEDEFVPDDEVDKSPAQCNTDNSYDVHNLSLADFRNFLVDHFNIAFR